MIHQVCAAHCNRAWFQHIGTKGQMTHAFTVYQFNFILWFKFKSNKTQKPWHYLIGSRYLARKNNKLGTIMLQLCSAKTTGSALSRRKISAPSIQNLLPFHQLATHWSISISLVVKSGGSISNSKWRCTATQALNMKPPIPETLLKNGT